VLRNTTSKKNISKEREDLWFPAEVNKKHLINKEVSEKSL